MNLKAAIILPSALFALAGGARSQPTTPFRSWNLVTKQSRDIIVAKCVKTTDDPQGAMLMRGSLIKSDLDIVTSLKGRTNLGPARLSSAYWPRAGEYYLIFALYMEDSGMNNVTAKYRVIPLGVHLPKDLLNGKTMADNLHILFRWRLDMLKAEIKDEEVEVQRLEQGLSESLSPQSIKKYP